MAGSGFSRSNTPQYGGLYKSPAGKTTAAAGAGGAIPRVQAPAVSIPNDPPVDLAGLGGLLYWMGQSPEGEIRMDMVQKPLSAIEKAAGAASALSGGAPDGAAALRTAQGTQWRPVFTDTRTGQRVPDPRGANPPLITNPNAGTPTYFDRQGRQIPGPDAGWFDRAAYNIKKWF